MSYVYKNEVGRPINIGGYQFAEGQELPSDILIERFKEAVSNKFLSLKEVKKSDFTPSTQKDDPDEEARKAAEVEAARKAEEEARLAEAARKAEEERLTEESRLAEEAAEAQRIADEEARKAVEEEKASNKKK